MTLDKLNYFVFIIALFEIVFGGGSNFVKYNGMSIRMALFVVQVALMFIDFTRKKMFDKNLLFLLTYFLGFQILSVFIGIYNNANFENILINFQSSFTFILLPFYYTQIRCEKNVSDVLKIIKIGAFLMVFFQFILIFALYNKWINFVSFYSWVKNFDELKFRSDYIFFYKGFIYVCICFIIYFVKSGIKNKLFSLIMMTSILATLTRGFIFFSFTVVFLYLIFISQKLKTKFYFVIMIIVVIGFVIPSVMNFRANNTGSNVKISDNVREITLMQVKERFDFPSMIFGHGLGIGVPIRPIGFENYFLDLYFKSGIIGLLFWVFVLIYISHLFFKLINSKYRYEAIVFWLGTVFLFLQSATNPYIGNAIGIPFVMLTLVVLTRLNQWNSENLRIKD